MLRIITAGGFVGACDVHGERGSIIYVIATLAEVMYTVWTCVRAEATHEEDRLFMMGNSNNHRLALACGRRLVGLFMTVVIGLDVKLIVEIVNGF